ncbi:transposase [Edwardsiella ictaluri]|uniref:transposase n=1 Tax=Edwardsiella ictaluri TaxID=67780 RepID=UPI000E00097C|nr:hypothetical protein STU22726_27630 [Edwardsiella ictaluri]BEI13909.1 hypothetical protein STU22816_27620 [Edwardsiella ictaluri]BEI17382.1 hypothetical protein STA22820_27550 [Edwardsiella ictaluri]BEI20872.1 hypothetical protein STH22820_27720 [Edwardsiella ictaluri]STP83750.1 Transposase, Mutator family [Edwardsiella ictaluri]
MADNSMTFSNPLMQLGGEDFLRELTAFMLNRIMEAESLSASTQSLTSAAMRVRPTATVPVTVKYNTRLGTLDLRIPTLREGTDFPPFPDARRLSEKVLNAVIREAWINGISTRKVDATGPVDGDDRYLPKPGVIPLPRHR